MCEYGASGNLEAIKVLIDNGVDCSIRGPGMRTAAHLAACHGMISVLDLLIVQGDKFDVNAIDAMGCTPLEDARRHNMPVAELLLIRNGGVGINDPSIPSRLQVQEIRVKEENKMQRRHLARRLAENSTELQGWKLIKDSYAAGLKKAFADFQIGCHQLQSAIAVSIGPINTVLASHGLVEDQGLAPAASAPNATHKRRTPIKVVEDLISRTSTFASAVTSTHEAVSADFPRRGALRIVVRDLVSEARGLRRRLKVCLELVKILKRSLQEVLALAQTSGTAASQAERAGSSGLRASHLALSQWRERRAQSRGLMAASNRDLTISTATSVGRQSPHSPLMIAAAVDEHFNSIQGRRHSTSSSSSSSSSVEGSLGGSSATTGGPSHGSRQSSRTRGVGGSRLLGGVGNGSISPTTLQGGSLPPNRVAPDRSQDLGPRLASWAGWNGQGSRGQMANSPAALADKLVLRLAGGGGDEEGGGKTSPLTRNGSARRRIDGGGSFVARRSPGVGPSAAPAHAFDEEFVGRSSPLSRGSRRGSMGLDIMEDDAEADNESLVGASVGQVGADLGVMGGRMTTSMDGGVVVVAESVFATPGAASLGGGRGIGWA
mmetsp:Transcript_4313/g.12598  ORF Transcript_4313/g.12598 Transcript_4313/m.12598 type:complete len:604 (-) Transcript_4313:309-2120(-)